MMRNFILENTKVINFSKEIFECTMIALEKYTLRYFFRPSQARTNFKINKLSNLYELFISVHYLIYFETF